MGYIIVITDQAGVKNTVTREEETVVFPTEAEALDTAQFVRNLYPRFTFTVEEA